MTNLCFEPIQIKLTTSHWNYKNKLSDIMRKKTPQQVEREHHQFMEKKRKS